MVATLFSTKRFLYSVFLNSKICEIPGCHAVIGARRVGKTVLLKQLAEYYKDVSVYKDLSGIKDDFSFDRFYRDAIDSDKKVIFLDEVCKLNLDFIADFIEFSKYYAGKLCIVISGSVASIVEKRCYEIGRGDCYELPPFMYIERLCWGNGLNTVDLEYVVECSTNDEFLKYIKNKRLSGKGFFSYIEGVLKDTISSYRDRTVLEDFIELESEKLVNALKYISLCQFVYRKSDGNFVDIPSLQSDIREKIIKDYKDAKRKWGLSSNDIQSTMLLLYCYHLARRLKYSKEIFSGFESLELESDDVPAIVFEYPLFSSICFSEELQNVSSMLDIWIECAILIRASYIYQYADKLRVGDIDEVDVIYNIGTDIYGIEVKNRSIKNISERYKKKEMCFADIIGLNEFLLSSCDGEDRVVRRNDRIVASLEFAYMDMLSKGNLYCGETIGELYKRYFEV